MRHLCIKRSTSFGHLFIRQTMKKRRMMYIVLVIVFTTYFGIIILLVRKAFIGDVGAKFDGVGDKDQTNIMIKLEVRSINLSRRHYTERKYNFTTTRTLESKINNDKTNLSAKFVSNEENDANRFTLCFDQKWKLYTKNISILRDELDELKATITNTCTHAHFNLNRGCVSLGRLKGRLNVTSNIESLNHTTYSAHVNFVNKGGWWLPPRCRLKRHVAIIIPFRNRDDHLRLLLYHLHPILKRQNLHYRIFVIEQYDNYSFNKGRLLNAGVLEIQKYFPYECLVFQDVDLIPEDDRVDYSCSQSPMHLAVYINKFNYTLFYPTIFGGVVSFRKPDYIRVNGFSNLFWVWGGEDDDLYQRVKLKNMTINRGRDEVGRYTMLQHINRESIRSEKQKVDSLKAMEVSIDHYEFDGLNSVRYRVVERKVKDHYTLIRIDLMKYAAFDLEEEYLKSKTENRKRKKQKGIDSVEIESLL